LCHVDCQCVGPADQSGRKVLTAGVVRTGFQVAN
jgi:hypothetical protein